MRLTDEDDNDWSIGVRVRVEIGCNEERCDDVSHGVAGHDVANPTDTELTSYHTLSCHTSKYSNSRF